MSLTLAHPTHPGEGLYEDIIAPRSLSVAQAAALLNVSGAYLAEVIAGRERLSAIIALKVEKAFGVPAHILYGIQANFDLYVAAKSPEMVEWRRCRSRLS